MKLARIWWIPPISTCAALLCAGCEFAASDLDQDVKLIAVDTDHATFSMGGYYRSCVDWFDIYHIEDGTWKRIEDKPSPPYLLGDAFIDYSGDCDIAVCAPYGAGQQLEVPLALIHHRTCSQVVTLSFFPGSFPGPRRDNGDTQAFCASPTFTKELRV